MMGINCLNHRICLLSTTSPRSSLVDHLWLETFFCCPSTPPPSSYLPLVVGGVVGGVLGGVALSVSAVPLLGVLGFSSVGVGVGSIAATLQTSQVVAGSWFALCQSAGALGVASGPIVVAASSTGAVIGGGLGAAVARVPPTISSLLDSYDDLVGAAKAATSSMHHAASKLFNAEAIALVELVNSNTTGAESTWRLLNKMIKGLTFVNATFEPNH